MIHSLFDKRNKLKLIKNQQLQQFEVSALSNSINSSDLCTTLEVLHSLISLAMAFSTKSASSCERRPTLLQEIAWAGVEAGSSRKNKGQGENMISVCVLGLGSKCTAVLKIRSLTKTPKGFFFPPF